MRALAFEAGINLITEWMTRQSSGLCLQWEPWIVNRLAIGGSPQALLDTRFQIGQVVQCTGRDWAAFRAYHRENFFTKLLLLFWVLREEVHQKRRHVRCLLIIHRRLSSEMFRFIQSSLTVSMPANKMSIIVQTTSFGSMLRTTSMSSMMLKLFAGSRPFSLIVSSVWLMYFIVVLPESYKINSAFKHKVRGTYVVKKSWASNRRRSSGVLNRRHSGNPCSSLWTALKVKMAESIIFCASESGVRSALRQPKRVFKPMAPTAVENDTFTTLFSNDTQHFIHSNAHR